MIDNFPASTADSAARNFEVITPDDDNDLPRRYKAIFVGVGGDIELVGDSDTGNVGVPHTVSTSSTLLTAPRRILATGTTADNLVGWF
jgi:hypothetical protein